MTTLNFTKNELEKLINYNLPCFDSLFKEVFNDIPFYHEDYQKRDGETHRVFCEDDGREYRWFIFEDKNGVAHCINYTYHTDYDNTITSVPDSIRIVVNEAESVCFNVK